SIDQGPFKLGTTRNTLGTTPEGSVLLGPERPRTYEDLSDTEKKRYDADVCATNIVLQGLPKDIYKLINHNIKAKAIWDNVKMLLAGSKLTKEDRESQLYDEFKRFKMLPGENINEYYVRFHKLVNDMRNIRMTMPKTQLTPEQVFWSLDLAKRKAEELKTNAPPLPVLPPATVYPPNTPVHLVPRTLPTTSQVNIGLFSDMHDAFTIAKKRIADLESENFNLRNKIQNDDHDSMIKHFSKLKVEHFNLQLKYQNLKERFRNKKPMTSSDAPSFDSLFVIEKLNEQIQSRGNTIR
ncbi:hypothetical protein Tco_1399551, partial [Tanacetum coccineum]